MKMPKNFLVLVLAVLVIVVIAVIWLSGSGKTFGVSKDSCDHKFLQWCKDNPRAGDYDNFGNTDRACIGQGNYRTCDQVLEALS